MAVRGGLTRFARPAGCPLTAFTVCPTGCRQLSNPGRGFSSPRCVQYTKKSPYFRMSSSLNMAVRGGLTRFARPAGSPLTAFTVCPTGCRQLSNPGRGFSSPARSLRSRSVQLAVASCRTPVGASHPPGVCNIRKKSPYFRTSSSLNMAVRGGFEPPIRCRIHTFQACSFSHSDTSPNCRSCLAGTGANLGKS